MWTVNVSDNGQPSQFKVDTGAEVTVISSAASTQLGITDPQPTTKQLREPDGTPLCTVGQATVKLAYQGREVYTYPLHLAKPGAQPPGTSYHSRPPCPPKGGQPGRSTAG